MWDDLLLAIGNLILDILPIPTQEEEDVFCAEIWKRCSKRRFPGRCSEQVLLHPLTSQPDGWYTCKRRYLPLLKPGHRVLITVQKGKNKIIRVSMLPEPTSANQPKKEIKP